MKFWWRNDVYSWFINSSYNRFMFAVEIFVKFTVVATGCRPRVIVMFNIFKRSWETCMFQLVLIQITPCIELCDIKPKRIFDSFKSVAKW